MLTLYNSLTREKQEFTSITPKKVGLYSCGPTAYDYAHIGNLRSYIYADLLRRVLSYNGFDVTFVMNITDVDDKTIKKSQSENKALKEVTEFYTDVFLQDLIKVNVTAPDILPKATEEIESMIALIKILLEKQIAYTTPSGDVYFNIAKYPSYGKLAQVDLSSLKQNADGRLDRSDEYEKEDVRDFVLWKSYDPTDGDVFWDTELGKGRPGWHIECSAMAAKYLGQPFDIHMGAVDLVFPHHTNEIAQSEAAYEKPLANFWVHPEHLLVDNAKMAKSKSNFFTSKDITDKGFDMLAFRYLALSAHYRSKLNFTWEGLQGAKNALNKLYKEISSYGAPGQVVAKFVSSFTENVNDDLNTPKSLAVLWDLIKSNEDGGDKLATLLKMDEVLGLNLNEVWKTASQMPDDVKEMVKARDEARTNKNFTKSDQLRTEISAKGYLVEDTLDGTLLKKVY